MQTIIIESNLETAVANSDWFIVDGDALIAGFASRASARKAKADGMEGKVMPKAELEFFVRANDEPQFPDLPAGDAVANAAEVAKVKTLLPNAAEILKLHGCPYCGDLGNGCTYDDKPGQETDYLYCHMCDTSFSSIDGHLRGAKKTGKIEKTRFSTIERPCKQVWHIADAKAKEAGGYQNLKRKEILAYCVANGIAFYTARTQYQMWLTIQKGGTL